MPNISQYTFNNLFIIYLLHLSSSFILTVYIRNQNIISAYQSKNCFISKITLCHLVSSYTSKTTPNGAKVKMTFSIGCDVSKQTLTLTRSRRHFPVLLSCISYKNLHYYPQNLFSERDGSKVNYHIFDYRLCNFYGKTDTSIIILIICQLLSTTRWLPKFSPLKTKVVLVNVTP